MCGRTTLFALRGDVEERFSATFTYDYEPRYNIAPEGPGLPTIWNEAADEIEQLHGASSPTESTIPTTGTTRSTRAPNRSPRNPVLDSDE